MIASTAAVRSESRVTAAGPESRRSYDGAQWPNEDFLTAVTGARDAGAAGWCFHTGAGFDLSTLSLFDQLDEVETDTVDELAGALGR